MKKFKVCLISFMCLVVGLIFTACGQPKLSFENELITLSIGQEVDPSEYLSLEGANFEDVVFTSSNSEILYITPENKLTGRNAGMCTLYAQAGATITQVSVKVEGERVRLSTPQGLTYNNGILSWQEVIERIDGQTYVCDNYELTLSRGEEEIIIENIVTNSYVLTEAGDYTATVKAVGGDRFLASDSSESYTFSAVFGVENLSYDEATSKLTWFDEKNAPNASYSIIRNGVYLDGTITKGENENFEVTLPLTSGETLTLQVVVSIDKFSISSEILKLSKLEALEISVENGTITWDSVIGAESYEVFVENVSTGTIASEEVSASSYNMQGRAAGGYRVYVRAKSTEGSTFESANSNVLTVTKLPVANLTFNYDTNEFSITNSQTYTPVITLTNTRTSATETVNAASYEFNKQDSDTYTVSAYFAAQTNSEINGDPCENYSVSRLGTATLTHTYNNGISSVSLDSILNAKNFVVYKKLGDGAYTELGSYEASGEGTETLNLGSGVFGEAGVYTLKVEAKNEGSAREIYITSEMTANVERLPNVQNVQVSGSTISWDAVPNATAYEYYFEVYGTENVALERVTTTATSIEIPSSLGYGEYTIKIKALGNNGTVLDALDYTASEKITIYEDLLAPSLTFDRNTLTLTLTPNDAIASTTYELKFYSADGRLQQTKTLLEDGVINMNVAEYLANAGVYRATAQALNANPLVNDSSVYEINIQKLIAPSLVKVQGGVVSTADANFNGNTAVLGANPTIIRINGQETAILPASESVFDIEVAYRSEEYRIVDGIRTYFLNSNFESFKVERLSSPANLHYDFAHENLVWDAVENVDHYNVYVNNLIVGESEESTFAYQSENAFTAKVVAFKEDIASLGAVSTGAVGYITSFESQEVNVNKADTVTGLKLDIGEGITLSWQGVTNVEGVIYKIYVDGGEVGESQSTSFTLTSDFSQAKTYTISVQATGSTFLSGEESSVTLEKLAAPTTLIKQAGVDVYILELISGAISFSVNGAVSESINLSDLTFEEGARTLNVKFDAIPSSEITDGKYYLSSEEASFSFARLDAPTNLAYNSGVISWNEVSGAKYVVEITNGQGTTIYQADTNSLSVSETDSFKFVVRAESAESIASVQAGAVAYLTSVNSQEFEVVKENSVENLKLDVIDGKVVISFTWTSKLSNVPNFEITLDGVLEGAQPVLLEGVYSYTFNQTFEEVKEFIIAVKVSGDVFITSSEESLVAERLKAPSLAKVTDGVFELNETTPSGVSGISINGSVVASLDLNAINENTDQEILVYYVATSPSEISNSHYYLDSATTTFRAYKLFTPNMASVSNGAISWNANSLANSYTLKITNSDGEEYLIENLTETSISVQDERLISFVSEIGDYSVQVRYIVNDVTSLSPYVEAENSPVANVSSSYSPAYTLTKLDVVSGLNISVDEQDPEQKEVTISWNASAGATSYTIYLNGVILSEIETTSIVLEEDVAASGNYTVAVRANSDDKISSELQEVSFSRLAPVNSASVDADAYVTWTKLGENPYYIVMYLDASGDIFHQGAVQDNFIDFSANENLQAYAGGVVNFKVLVSGNGTSTLSSAYYEFAATKLTAPNLVVNAASLYIEEAGYAPENSYNFSLSIQMPNSGSITLEYTNTSGLATFAYPEYFLSGEYTFTAKMVSKTLNVITSNEVSITKTRLDTISNHVFKREALTAEQEANYTSDGATTYLSDKIYIEFTPSANASSYSLSVGSSYTASLPLDSSRIDITGALDTALYGNFTLRVISEATDDSNYINSPSYYITGRRLNALQEAEFMTRDGKVSWTDYQTGVNGYLIKVSEIEGADWGYWQSTDGSVRVANLNGLDSGIKAYNIKALGNITESGISTGVILDSSYLTDAKQFNKLEKPVVTVYNGFIALNTIENATQYIAYVNGIAYTLEDHSYMSQIENQFIGYNESMATNLDANVTYQVTVQARGQSTEIYSDYSEPINIKFLENVNTNTGDVKLVLDPSGDLTKTKLTFNLAANNEGAVIHFRKPDGNYIYTGFANYISSNRTESVYELNRSSFSEYMENATIRVASRGSSSLQGDFYYLNSAFSQGFNLKALADPQNVRIENGILTWDAVESASGYYIYINRNQYYVGSEYEMYTGTSLALPERYGSLTNNTVYTIGVVAVSATTDYVSSHWHNSDQDLEGTYYIEDVVLPHAPDEIDLVDGGLVWSDGLSGLDNANINLVSLALNINTLFNSPILLLYNAASGLNINLKFEIPGIELQFTNIVTNEKYNIVLNSNMTNNADGSVTLDLEYLDFIKVSHTQIQKIQELRDFILDNGGTFGITEDDQMIKVMNELIRLFQEKLEDEESIGWPNIYTLFDELKGENNIPAGRYYLQIRQVGDSVFLNSNFNSRKEVYIPEAPYNLTIEAPETLEGEKQFYLSWDNVTINSSVSYAPANKYLVIAENSLGERRIVARVDESTETSAGNNRTRINITTLVNDGTLTPDDVKLFVVVAGDSNVTLTGIKSNVVNVQILPEVTPFMEEGYLSWDTLASAYGIQIIATNEAHIINETIALSTNSRRWAGDGMTPGTLYSASIRAVGDVYISTENGVKTFIISGKKTDFSLHKLNAPTVNVNTSGLFNWNAVTGNVSGYIVAVGEEEVYLTADTLSYESTFAGFNLYKFRAQGDTCQIEENGTYYINSLPNMQEGKSYYGTYGVMLPGVSEIVIEEGNLKWSTVNLSLYNLNSIADQDNYKQKIVYKLIIGDNVYYINQEDYQDVNGRYVTFGDFEELPAGTYNMSLQAFIYWTPKVSTGSLPDMIASFTNTVDGGSDYFALLGSKESTLTGTISKAKSITADMYVSSGLAIEDGMIVWDFVTETDEDGFELKKHLDYILTFATDENFTQNVVTVNATFDGTTLYAKWWDEVLTDGLSYYVKVKVNGKDSYLSSSNSVYADSASSPVVLRTVSLVRFESMLMNEGVYPYGDEDYGNYIRVELNSSALQALSSTFNFGFEIRYRAIGSDSSTPWNTYNFGRLDYIAGEENTVIYTLDISKLGGVTSFEYQVQLVLLDESNTRWLKSNWSDRDNFNTPEPVEAILLDEERQEFYWKDELIPESSTYYGYIVLDELLDDEGNVISSYKFIIPSGSHSGEDYSALIGADRYIYYAPFEMGTHRISVRKTPDNQGALVSSETYYKAEDEVNEYTPFEFNLFTVSELSTADHGSSANPYLISNSTDFLNIALRATKYSYMTTYENESGEEVSGETTYTFRQTADIEIESTINGYFVNTFKNVYDGNNFKLTYTIANSGSNASLINTIGENGAVRNVRLDVTLNSSNSTITFASLALNNSGSIYNSVLENVHISSSSASINYAGFVYSNYGRIERVVSMASFTATNIANAGAIVYSNARTTAIVYQSGNVGDISLNGARIAQRLGGITVSNSGSIDECYNKGSLSINSNVADVQIGGIVAQNAVNSVIVNTYSTGTVTLSGNHTSVSLGGIVGYSANNNITNSYATQVITSPAGGVSDTLSYGAIIGRLQSSISERNNYYSAASTSAIGNMYSSIFATGIYLSDYIDEGFVDRLNNGDNAFIADVAGENLNGGYPIFVWETSEELLYNNMD